MEPYLTAESLQPPANRLGIFFPQVVALCIMDITEMRHLCSISFLWLSQKQIFPGLGLACRLCAIGEMDEELVKPAFKLDC